MVQTQAFETSSLRGFGGHPKGLFVLFLTEMWERFSYYGMRALLVYYMTKHLMFSQEKSSQIYGLYTGLVYFTPFFGGILADRYWGQRRTVILGGVIMALGHFLMAFESMFYPALLMIILGNGAFKPNISSQVGNLYPKGDSRLDRAYSIYYVGVNLGAFLAPFICGTLGEVYGWHYGFGAAGVGMVAGLVIYLFNQKHLADDNVMSQRAEAKAAGIAVKTEKLDASERSRVLSLTILFAFTIVFWATYEQQGNTLALWADANTDRHLFGPGSWEIPASWFQALNPAMIFGFTPLLNSFWAGQNRRGKEPNSTVKMAIGCILLGLSFLVMIPGAWAYERTGSASAWWLIGCTGILTVGELYLSPIGMSLVTKVAPARVVSMMMGIYFMASFFGNYLCGYVGTFWEKMPKETFFLMLAGASILAGVGILVCKRYLERNIDEDAHHPAGRVRQTSPEEAVLP